MQEVRVAGDLAYSWTKLSIVITPLAGGTPIRRSGDTLSILQKQAGKWVLIRDANWLTVADALAGISRAGMFRLRDYQSRSADFCFRRRLRSALLPRRWPRSPSSSA